MNITTQKAYEKGKKKEKTKQPSHAKKNKARKKIRHAKLRRRYQEKGNMRNITYIIEHHK